MRVDPIKLLMEKAALATPSTSVETALAIDAGLPFEIPLSPLPGARVIRATIASTYRTPIPVLYDASTKTTFPMDNRG